MCFLLNYSLSLHKTVSDSVAECEAGLQQYVVKSVIVVDINFWDI